MAKKSVLVTLVDEKYLEYAKQVFAGAYFNADWKGDFLILAHNIPHNKLHWFRSRGIYIKNCSNIFADRKTDINLIHYSKLYLFGPEMKKWSKVIFLDVDTIIRASLNNLVEIRNLAAVPNLQIKFGWYFKKNRFFSKYNSKETTFCSGIMVFNTDIIKKNTFQNFVKIIKKYENFRILSRDEAFFNLFFYHQWEKLPQVYNVCLDRNLDLWRLPLSRLKGIIIHPASQGNPWHKKSIFYKEWFANYKRAEEIFLKKGPNFKKWSKSKILSYSFYLKARFLYFNHLDYYLWRYNELYFKMIHYFERRFPAVFKFFKKTKVKIIGK